MKTNIKNKLATGLMGALAVVTMGVATTMAPATVDAVACPPGTKQAGNDVDNYALCNMDDSQVNDQGTSMWDTVNTMINVVLGIIGLLAVIMVIYGGFKIVMSEGSADKVKSGKETILYGIVGLLIALLAFALVNFVLSAFFGGSNSTPDPEPNPDPGLPSDEQNCINSGGTWSPATNTCVKGGNQ